jgi:membrane protease YdiL (CAAX protease family)
MELLALIIPSSFIRAGIVCVFQLANRSSSAFCKENTVNAVASLVKRYPLVVFSVIAIGTSFLGWSMAQLYSSDLWQFFLFGPLVGALVVIPFTDGRTGLKEWSKRIIRWRVGWHWYAVALLLPVALHASAFGLNRLLGAPMPAASQMSFSFDLLPEFVIVFLFIGLAEEPGFRGFLLQRLLAGKTALYAGSIMAVIVAVWHVPLFIYGIEPITILPVILAGMILVAWIYVNTNGSVLITMLMHAMLNTVNGYFNGFYTDEAMSSQHTILLAVVFVVAAVALVALTGPSLVRRQGVRPAVA